MEDSLEKDRLEAEAAPIEGEIAGVREKADEGEAERIGESVGEGVEVFFEGMIGLLSVAMLGSESDIVVMRQSK